MPASTSKASHTMGASSWVPVKEKWELLGSPMQPQTDCLKAAGCGTGKGVGN